MILLLISIKAEKFQIAFLNLLEHQKRGTRLPSITMTFLIVAHWIQQLILKLRILNFQDFFNQINSKKTEL